MIAGATAKVLDRIGFDLAHSQIAHSGADSETLERRFPQASIIALQPGSPICGEHDLILIFDEVAMARLAERVAEALPRCHWVIAVLPATMSNWDGLDSYPVVHRFVVAPDLLGAGSHPKGDSPLADRCFGFVVQGRLQPQAIPIRKARDLLLPPKLEPNLARDDLRLLIVGPRNLSVLMTGEYFDPDRIRTIHPTTLCSDSCEGHYDAGTESIVAAIGRLFPDWEPTAVVFPFVENLAIPRGTEELPWITVAAISDWNLAMRHLFPCLGVFDFIVGDANGMQLLRALGMERVHYWPMFSYAQEWGDVDVAPAKLYDVAFIGNLNHAVQRDRTRYIKRAAALSSEYRVFFGDGIRGANYAQTIARSRITLNRSIRGELNLRCYEAPAFGSLLFVEDTNDEIRTLFRPGEDCILYDSQNFEFAIQYYLKNEPERERIARNGRAIARASSYSSHFSGLLGMIRDLVRLPPSARPTRVLPTAEKLHRLARLSYHGAYDDSMISTLALLEEAHRLRPDSSAIKADLAVVLATLAESQERYATMSGPNGTQTRLEAKLTAQRAGGLFREVLALDPENSVYRLNGAWFLRRTDKTFALELLVPVAEGVGVVSDGLLFPGTFGHLAVEIEKIGCQFANRPENILQESSKLLAWQAATWLGDASASHPEWSHSDIPDPPDLELAFHWYQKAVELRPDLPESQFKFGSVLLYQGSYLLAAGAFQRGLEDDPLSITGMKGVISALFGLGEVANASDLCDDFLVYSAGIPCLLKNRGDLRQIVREAGKNRSKKINDHNTGLKLENLRENNTLLFAEGMQTDWLPEIAAYIAKLEPNDRSCLLVYSADRSVPALISEIEEFFANNAIDLNSSPDIVVVERVLSSTEEIELLDLVQSVCLTPVSTRLAIVRAVGTPLKSFL